MEKRTYNRETDSLAGVDFARPEAEQAPIKRQVKTPFGNISGRFGSVEDNQKKGEDIALFLPREAVTKPLSNVRETIGFGKPEDTKVNRFIYGDNLFDEYEGSRREENDKDGEFLSKLLLPKGLEGGFIDRRLSGVAELGLNLLDYTFFGSLAKSAIKGATKGLIKSSAKDIANKTLRRVDAVAGAGVGASKEVGQRSIRETLSIFAKEPARADLDFSTVAKKTTKANDPVKVKGILESRLPDAVKNTVDLDDLAEKLAGSKNFVASRVILNETVRQAQSDAVKAVSRGLVKKDEVAQYINTKSALRTKTPVKESIKTKQTFTRDLTETPLKASEVPENIARGDFVFAKVAEDLFGKDVFKKKLTGEQRISVAEKINENPGAFRRSELSGLADKVGRLNDTSGSKIKLDDVREYKRAQDAGEELSPKQKAYEDYVIEETNNLTSSFKGLTPDTARFVNSIGDDMFDGVGMMIKEKGGVDGLFNYTEEIVQIFKNSQTQKQLGRTQIHELWHVLARNLPEAQVQKVKAMYEADKGKLSAERIEEMAKEGFVWTDDTYKFKNVDEWFAETMTNVTERNMKWIGDDERSILLHAKRLMQKLIRAIRNTFNKDNPEKIFDDFIKGRYPHVLHKNSWEYIGNRYKDPDIAYKENTYYQKDIDRARNAKDSINEKWKKEIPAEDFLQESFEEIDNVSDLGILNYMEMMANKGRIRKHEDLIMKKDVLSSLELNQVTNGIMPELKNFDITSFGQRLVKTIASMSKLEDRLKALRREGETPDMSVGDAENYVIAIKKLVPGVDKELTKFEDVLEQALIIIHDKRINLTNRASIFKSSLGESLNAIKAMNKISSTNGRLDALLRKTKKFSKFERESLNDLLLKIDPDEADVYEDILDALNNPDWIDKIVEYATAIKLYNPTTHFVNLGSNALRQMVDIGIRGVTSPELLKSDLLGVVQGFKDGMYHAKKAVFDEDYSSMLSKQQELGSGTVAIGGVGGKVVRTSFRLLGASDEVFRNIALNRYYYREGYKLAKDTGMSIDEAITSLKTQPIDSQVYKEAHDYAKHLVFQDDVEGWWKKVDEVIRDIASEPNYSMAKFGKGFGRIMIPFYKTPLNLMKQGFIDFSPLALNKIRKMPAGEARRVLVGEMVLGSSLALTFAYLAGEGLITGHAPTDKKERAFFYDIEKKKPYSLKVGDTWYSFSRLDPLFISATAAANMVQEKNKRVQRGQESTAVDYGGDLVASVTSLIEDKTFYTGFNNMMNLIKPDYPGQQRVIINQMITGSTIPNISGAVTRAYSPEIADTYVGMDWLESLGAAFRAQVPGASRGLENKIDLFGDPVVRHTGGTNFLFNPMAGIESKQNEVQSVLQNKGVRITVPNSYYTLTEDGVKYKYQMSSKRFAEYQEMLNGQLFAELNTPFMLREIERAESVTEAQEIVDDIRSDIVRDVNKTFRELYQDEFEKTSNQIIKTTK